MVDGNSERRDTVFLRLFLTLTGLTVAVILDTLLPYVIATRAIVIVVLIITTTAGACGEVN